MSKKKGIGKDAEVPCPSCGVSVFVPASASARNCHECGTLVRR